MTFEQAEVITESDAVFHFNQLPVLTDSEALTLARNSLQTTQAAFLAAKNQGDVEGMAVFSNQHLVAWLIMDNIIT